MRTVVYHANCRDGFAAAWAVRTVFPDANFVPGNYGMVPNGFPFSGDDVVFVDFSLPRDQMELIAQKSGSLIVLDHHKTAEAALADFPDYDGKVKVVFDMERSGAGIAWDFFHDHSYGTCPSCGASAPTAPQEHHDNCSEARPWFIDFVEDRDLWRFRLMNSRQINAYLGTRQFTFDEWDELLKPGALGVALDAGIVVERKTQAYVTEVCKNAHAFDTGAGVAFAVNAPQVDISEVLAELLALHPQADYTIGWWRRQDRRYQFGLRSRPGSDVDVSGIAKVFGGGGHKHAAGFHHESPLGGFGW